tara:strand:- start:5573 stop:6520 length:948 start_codon:yes stop_codon:yes gene_type:complete
MNRKAIIIGLKGYKLTNKEKKLLKKFKPWGIILFSRNIKNEQQLKKLTDNIKKIFKDNKYPILIDQEGGQVSRLNNVIDLSIFSQIYFSKLYSNNKKLFYICLKTYINSICSIFKNFGINVNTVPVLDVKRKNTHKIIFKRSFSDDPKKVLKLGNFYVDLYNKAKIATVIKHIPGHGQSTYDSHYNTPIIKTNKNELIKKDFKPFKMSKSLFAMTAHVVYSAYDLKNTATHSKVIIKKIIRKHMRFKGILISDDISMKSLKYGILENAKKALKAGCNLVLHCNGNISEMNKLVKIIPKIDKFTQKKTSHFYKFLG